LIMEQLKSLPIEDKRVMGPVLNEFKAWATQEYQKAETTLAQRQSEQAIAQQKYFDVTTYKLNPPVGRLHIYTQIIQQLQDIFMSMGWAIADGPEIENERYNFTALNIPTDHPAREMHDTFWLNVPDLLMRTHTSSVQIHTMEKHNLPLAVFAPGRTYRNEATDASHDFMFTQGEGLMIDKNISLAHLLATAQAFLQAFFEIKDLKIRVRPGYFPFVEPGIEIDCSCPFCTTGCSVCKKTTWIELLGAGLVHPNVLRFCGIDPEVYSGFAFGFGVERLAMIKYGITDIRLFHSSKISFLDQF
ncbi:MAG TPA: phenylalanine--tRNA ligase subunit alpha, partial [Candidatus Limnocylindria bacterium]|nr:phenylalanine--tRNA ligase subunit alpha [Candidatus Limnocylindria bacterium]